MSLDVEKKERPLIEDTVIYYGWRGGKCPVCESVAALWRQYHKKWSAEVDRQKARVFFKRPMLTAIHRGNHPNTKLVHSNQKQYQPDRLPAIKLPHSQMHICTSGRMAQYSNGFSLEEHEKTLPGDNLDQEWVHPLQNCVWVVLPIQITGVVLILTISIYASSELEFK